MPVQCPTCSRINPANATYCFYDGRALGNGENGQQGPVGLGTRPFPLPFSFSDGHGCANYNQLVLACDRHWNEARTNLTNGTWESFFSTIGRADLAILAQHAAREADPDIGLCRLLEGLPADPEALRPPKLGLTSLVEHLGALEPGKDHKFQVVIENQGVLLLQGSVITDCDWLYFGDRQGNTAAKLFQTRDSYTLSVRIVGHALRAGRKPLDGKIHIDTNGGRQTVAVHAIVPVRPFPTGKDPSNVLAGARSPRELAVKAKDHPREAAGLFEQGVVKAWYESNGWTYPIQGTQARGKGALQQFFEALGLTKPPRLAIDTERINCRGKAGDRLGKDVVLRTEESKFVHAEAHSNQPWLKVLPTKAQGNSATIPLRIDVPACPGETLHATVTCHGNGRQQFVVPVTLTVGGAAPKQKAEEPRRSRGPQWILAGVGLCLLLVVGVAVAVIMNQDDSGKEGPSPVTDGGTPPPPPPPSKAWWDKIPRNNLAASAAKLKALAGENSTIFTSLEAESDDVRRKGCEQLAAKLPDLWRTPALREPLGQFVTECCVFEPSEYNLTLLLRGLASQLPGEDSEFPAGDRGETVERASFWLGVLCDAILHKARRASRSRDLASELGKVLAVDSDTPPAELKERAEKALAEQCYSNMVKTAGKSFEQALTIREVLIARFSQHLTPEVRDLRDLKLLELGLARGNELWPKLKPLFESCANNAASAADLTPGNKIVDLYAKANAELAPKMEEVLAVRWKVAGNAKLAHADKAAALRNAMAVAARAIKISHADRVKQLQRLLGKRPWALGKPGPQQDIACLQETVRLAHASTMACLLSSKDAEAGRFDELVAHIPALEQAKPPEEEKNPEVRPQQPGGRIEVIHMGTGTRVMQGALTADNDLDPRRGTYRKEYHIHLRAQEIYHIYMRSTAMTPYIRLESSTGRQLSYDQGPQAHITFVPQLEGDYRLVASSSEKKAVGRFTLQISPQQQVIRLGFRGRFPYGGPVQMPVQDQDPGGVERKTAEVNLSDLASLRKEQKSDARIAAFKNLAGNVSNDLAYRHAARMARYLLQTLSDDSELNAVADSLPSLSRCRHLLQALADGLAEDTALSQQRTVAIVGGLLGQPQLRFDRDADWRSACRKMLLQRSLELTGRGATNEADRAADLLRDLYKEQGLALGLDAPDFEEQTHLAPVLARLIKHVAGRAVMQEVTGEDRALLEQIDRRLQAVQFVAANDLEHVVLLQRIWVKVLALALQGQAEGQRRKLVMEVPQKLDNKDAVAGSLLDQLRTGEESALEVWELASDLKRK